MTAFDLVRATSLQPTLNNSTTETPSIGTAFARFDLQRNDDRGGRKNMKAALFVFNLADVFTGWDGHNSSPCSNGSRSGTKGVGLPVSLTTCQYCGGRAPGLCVAQYEGGTTCRRPLTVDTWPGWQWLHSCHRLCTIGTSRFAQQTEQAQFGA